MKSGQLPQISSTASCSQSVCEKCGEQFSCGASASGCWCVEVKLTEEALAKLRERYGSCLCRACLEGFALNEEPCDDEKFFSQEPEKLRA